MVTYRGYVRIVRCATFQYSVHKNCVLCGDVMCDHQFDFGGKCDLWIRMVCDKFGNLSHKVKKMNLLESEDSGINLSNLSQSTSIDDLFNKPIII